MKICYNERVGIYQADSGSLTEPLWDASTNAYPYPSNAAFVREFTIKLLSTSFRNMTASEVIEEKTNVINKPICE